MELGLIGLGKMGLPLALNMKEQGIDVLLFSSSKEKISSLKTEGFKGYTDLKRFVHALTPPRCIWLMIPAGEAVDDMIEALLPLMEPDDILVDGGNSHYKDSRRRCSRLLAEGVHFMDVGTSGGTEGARFGACLMVGGSPTVYHHLLPIFKAISRHAGCEWLGDAGAGHYVKMIHNGIEYGMMQAIGEGLDILRASEYAFQLDAVARTWQHGSIVSGLLMDMTAKALEKDPELAHLEGVVGFSGEAHWTLQEALDLGISAPAISAALFARFKSRDTEHTSEKAVAAMRQAFGGHSVIARGQLHE